MIKLIYGYHIIGKEGKYIIIYPVLMLENNDKKYLIYRRKRSTKAKTYIGLIKEKNEVVPIEEIVMKLYEEEL